MYFSTIRPLLGSVLNNGIFLPRNGITAHDPITHKYGRAFQVRN